MENGGAKDLRDIIKELRIGGCRTRISKKYTALKYSRSLIMKSHEDSEFYSHYSISQSHSYERALEAPLV